MARKIVRGMSDWQNAFQKAMLPLCQTRSSWQVWTDFISMVAIAIANSVDQTGPIHDERERQYMHTIQQYSEKERYQFPELFRITIEALESEPEQDFLGEMFMALELGNHWKGQFFTPYCICKAMAEITIGKDVPVSNDIKKRGWIGINDPACGAGATLIAVRNILIREKMSPYQALFVAQDIDRVAGLMCYIQLSLLGCAGYVVIADTLVHPIEGNILDPIKAEYNEIWYTPFFATYVWQARRTWARVDALIHATPSSMDCDALEAENVEEDIHAAQPVPDEPVFQTTEAGQLKFF